MASRPTRDWSPYCTTSSTISTVSINSCCSFDTIDVTVDVATAGWKFLFIFFTALKFISGHQYPTNHKTYTRDALQLLTEDIPVWPVWPNSPAIDIDTCSSRVDAPQKNIWAKKMSNFTPVGGNGGRSSDFYSITVGQEVVILLIYPSSLHWHPSHLEPFENSKPIAEKQRLRQNCPPL